MKLIYIANVRMPTEKAHGIQIMKMCKAFASHFEVELVLPWRFNHIKKDPFDYYGVKKSFSIKKLPSLDLIPTGVPKIGFWIQSISFAKWVFWYLLFKKTDLIYSRDPGILFFPSFFKKNIVVEIHQFPRCFYLYQRVFRRARRIIVITQKLKELFVQKGIPADKILVAPDGVDLEEFNIEQSQEQCRCQLNLPLDTKIIGYVGQLKTMETEKGIGCLIKALKILKKNNPSIALCLVGGQQSDILKYQELTKRLGLTKQDVIFTGQVQHHLIPFYLKSFDVLVMPFPWTKHYAYYMSPLKMFEYMASQRPIIASDLPSIREILDKRNAILIKPGNLQSLAEGITNALRNPDFSAKISQQAFEDVRNYTWTKRAQKIIDFINL